MLKFHQIIDRQIINRARSYVETPSVSIVLLALSHFSVEYILKYIDSILKQTLSDYECIILDCDLNENCIQAISDLTKEDSRFVLVRHSIREIPVACSLDEGVLLAKAPYIALNQNGAVWHPEALQQLMAAASSTSADVVYGNVEYQKSHPQDFYKTPPLSRDTINIINIIPVGAILCQSQFFKSYGLFDPHVLIRDFYDWDLWRRALKLGGSFYHLNRVIGFCEDSQFVPAEKKMLDVFVCAYLCDDQYLLTRSQELIPNRISSYDLFQSEKILRYVRDIPEWERVDEKYFKHYTLVNPEIEYSPPTKHNRLYDHFLEYSLNPPMAVSKPRKRVVLAIDIADRVVEDWKDALVIDENNIILISSVEYLDSITPADVDHLIFINCFKDGADVIAKEFQDNGVSVLHVLSRTIFSENKFADVQFIKKWQQSTDQIVMVGMQSYEIKERIEGVAYITFPFNGLENIDTYPQNFQTLNWGVFIGNHTQNLQNLLNLPALQDEKCQWMLFVSQQNEEILKSLPDNVRVVYTNDTLNTLVSNLSDFCLFVPDEILAMLDSYEHLLLEEDALRFSNSIIPFVRSQEITAQKHIKDWFYMQFNKWKSESLGHHPKARFLYIQNLILSVDLRKKIATLRSQKFSSEVKALVMVNSQAIAGSENFGLLVTKGLFDLGIEVRFCTPSNINIHPPGLKISREWLEKRKLPPPIQADYGRAGYALWYPDFPEEEALKQSRNFRDWLNEEGFGLVFCSAMIPEPFIAWRDNALTFMALFAPWEYNLDRLTFIGKRVDGLFSDSHWALDPWVEMNPSLNAYTPSMVENEYFQILNNDLPHEPVQIAIAGTIQPRKRQKEAVLAVRDLINKGYNVVLNIYGYQLDGFQSYIQEVKEIAALPEMIGKVKFWGFVDDPHQISRDNHILLCASTDESASQSVLFNQAAGLIPVSCPAGGIPEIVIEGKTGFLADGFESGHIVVALERALKKRGDWPHLIGNAQRFLLYECTEPEFMRRILKVMMAAAEIKLSKGARLFRDTDMEPLHTISPETEVTPPSATDLEIGLNLTHKAIVYSLEVESDGLTGFTFQPGTHGTQPHGEMKISVFLAGHSEKMREAKVNLGELRDNQWAQVMFEPILHSKGQNYQVVANAKIKHGRVTLYESYPGKWNKQARFTLRIQRFLHRYLNVSIRRPSSAVFAVYQKD